MTSILTAKFFHNENVGTEVQVSQLLDDINSVYDATPSTDATNLDCWRSSHVYENISCLV